MKPATESALAPLCAAGLPEHEAREWSESFPITTGEFESDAREYVAFWRCSAALLGRLPAKPQRNEAERAAAEALLSDARASRESFLAAHVEQVYDRLTESGSTFRRLDDLVYAAAKLVPGLVPTREEAEAEAAHRQRRQGWRRDRPGPVPCACAFASAHRRASAVTPCCCRGRKAPPLAPNSLHTARSISAPRASRDAATPFIST